MSARVSNAYRLVILWGGLRGAVSLALALAVSENTGLPGNVRHFVAVLATGFVLFTLLVNGTTLQLLLRLLHLDRLSKVDRAVRDRAIMLSLDAIRQRISAVAESDRIAPAVTARICEAFAQRISDVRRTAAADVILSDADLLQIGLITLATREQELHLQRYKERVVSRKSVQVLIARAGWLLDGAKTGGRSGYEAAARRGFSFTVTFRIALALHRRLGFTRWLAQELADRFERLLIVRMGLQQLLAFNERQLTSLLGSSQSAKELTLILGKRVTGIEQGLAALRLQFPEFARTLESRYLERVAAQLEGAEYGDLLAESIISREVHNDLDRQLSARWRDLERRPALDIELKTRAADRPRAAVRRPRHPAAARASRACCGRVWRCRASASSPAAPAATPCISSPPARSRCRSPRRRSGWAAAISSARSRCVMHQPRNADVVALGYCHLLVLRQRDFERLLAGNPDLRVRIDTVARERLSPPPATSTAAQ